MDLTFFRRASRCSKGGCAEVASTPAGGVILRATNRPDDMIVLDAAEWRDLVTAIKGGEFDCL